jgi:hypothetical protein
MTDAQYAAVMGKLDAVLLALKGGAHAPSAAGTAAGPKVASDAELDGPKGDPVAGYTSFDWKGESFKGKRFSECSTEFLLQHAAYLEWKAANPKPGKEQYATGDRLDAARARGWAARPMTGPDTPAAPEPGMDDIPF